MKSVSFGIRRVNRLRRAAEKARELASDVDIVSAFRNVPTKVDQAHGCDQSRRE